MKNLGRVLVISAFTVAMQVAFAAGPQQPQPPQPIPPIIQPGPIGPDGPVDPTPTQPPSAN